jgi:hypothetical protein
LFRTTSRSANDKVSVLTSIPQTPSGLERCIIGEEMDTICSPFCRTGSEITVFPDFIALMYADEVSEFGYFSSAIDVLPVPVVPVRLWVIEN